MRRAHIWTAAAVVAAWGLGAASAWAQSGPPPAWPALIHCAQMTDPAEELACYRAAMRTAGYAPSSDVAIAEKHKHFGLPRPSVNFLKHPPKQAQAAAPAPVPAPVAPVPAAPSPQLAQAQPAPAAGPPPPAAPAPPAAEANEDLATFQIVEVALIPPGNKLLIVTNDGGVWKQTDTESVTPFPKAGSTLQIRRTRFGGYFCRFDRNNSVRCTRVH